MAILIYTDLSIFRFKSDFRSFCIVKGPKGGDSKDKKVNLHFIGIKMHLSAAEMLTFVAGLHSVLLLSTSSGIQLFFWQFNLHLKLLTFR